MMYYLGLAVEVCCFLLILVLHICGYIDFGTLVLLSVAFVGIVFVVAVCFVYASEPRGYGGHPTRIRHRRSDNYVMQVRDSGYTARRHMDTISDDYLQQVRKVLGV